MQIVPITQRAAKKFIDNHHRHLKAPAGSIFQIGLSKNSDLVGVVMVGRPVSRCLDNGFTVEVNRNCVLEGIKNGTSMLLGAAARVARELGYEYIITYTLDFEGGASLRAVGWKRDSEHISKNGWNSRKNRQIDMFPDTKKVRWVKKLNNRKRK